jgi:hypothetical protein
MTRPPKIAGPGDRLIAPRRRRVIIRQHRLARERLDWYPRPLPPHYFLISQLVSCGMSIAVYPFEPARAGIELQANGSLPVMPAHFPVPPVIICVPQFMAACDLSTSRVSKVEKILSPSLSARTQAPSIYFLSRDATLSAVQCADILSAGRFRSSKAVGAHFGLTSKKYQSGETDVTGRISKIGDGGVRTALYEAANVILTRPVKGSTLKSWGMRLAARAGMRKAKVALARKLAVVLHRMLADSTEFLADKAAAAVAR